MVVELYLAQEVIIGEIKERHHVRILVKLNLELRMEQKYPTLQKLKEDTSLDIILSKQKETEKLALPGMVDLALMVATVEGKIKEVEEERDTLMVR